MTESTPDLASSLAPVSSLDPASSLAPVIVVTPARPGLDVTTCAAALVVGCQEAGLAPRVAALVRVTRDAPPSSEPSAEPVTEPIAEPIGEPVTRLTGAPASTAHVLTAPPGALVHPPTLAQRDGVRLTPAIVHATLVAGLARTPGTDLVVLQDPLGLLVPIDADGATLVDVAQSLDALGVRVGFVLVTGDGPDDLAPMLLAADVLRSRGRDVLGLAVYAHGAVVAHGTVFAHGAVFAQSPERPASVTSDTRAALLADCAGLTLLGVVPGDAATWDPQTFQDRAGAWMPVL